MKKNKHSPSPIALAFFRWYCRSEFREEIEGDLMERFNTHTEQYGSVKANQIFIQDVILLFRPTLVRSWHPLIHTEHMAFIKHNQRLGTILATATALLCIPWVAMRFTSEVDWNGFDFIVAGILLFGSGLLLEFILRKMGTHRFKFLLIAALFLTLILIWVELAVGLFGTALSGS